MWSVKMWWNVKDHWRAIKIFKNKKKIPQNNQKFQRKILSTTSNGLLQQQTNINNKMSHH